jgi:hypothetical protein
MEKNLLNNYRLNNGKKLGEATREDLFEDAKIEFAKGKKLKSEGAILLRAADIMGNRSIAEAIKIEQNEKRLKTLIDAHRLFSEQRLNRPLNDLESKTIEFQIKALRLKAGTPKRSTTVR